MPDVRDLLASAAAAPRRPLDTHAVLGRARSLRRRRAAVAFAALVPVAAAIPLVLPDARPANYVTAPDAPGVAFGRLGDGTRVYVVRHDDGTVTVLDARSTHAPAGGLGKQVGWCPGRSFVDPMHGSRWDERGVYVWGPAPSDLPYYRVRPHGDGWVVGDRVERPARGAGRYTGPPCGDDAGLAPAVLWDGPGGGEDRTYASVADLPEGRAARVEGVVLVEPAGARLCDEDGSPCLPFGGEPAGGRGYQVRGTFLARRDGERLVEVVSVGGQSRPIGS